MPPPLQPEFFILLGLDLFLAMSLLTCLLDRHFPWQLPFLYQLAALIGFGQLLVSREFLGSFDEYMRFWYSTLYMAVALANIIGVNVYLGVIKKLLNYAKVTLFAITFPALTVSAFFITSYTSIALHPFAVLPQLSWEATFVALVAFDVFVVGIGTYVFFKPKWWYVAAGSSLAIASATVYALLRPTWGQAAFVVSAVALGLACVLVLGASVYILARIWVDTLKQRKRKKEVK